MQSSAEYTHKEPCPNCNSRDNLARYSDGHGFCFGCAHYEPGNGDVSEAPSKIHAAKSSKPLLTGDPSDLSKRGILKATAERWRYHAARDEDGKSVQVANYCDDRGRIVAQKLRYPDKRFGWRGDKAATGLYGQWLWKDGGRMLIVTEGEIDALSVSQLQQNKWPVVSVPDGAQGASKSFRKSIDFLNKFEKVVLMFDQDEHGRKAAEECSRLLKPGQCFIASLPLKDANEMLQAGRGDEVIKAAWEAKASRPDGIMSGASLAHKATRPIEWGLPYPFASVTHATYGRRWGEVITIGAGTGVGKTDFLTQCIEHDLFQLGETVGALFLEQQPEDTLRRILGKHIGKRLHIPDAVPLEEMEAAFAEAAPVLERLFLYDHFGATDWEVIEERLRFLAVGCGCKVIYLDHLTALAAGAEDERKALEDIMAKLAGLAQELKIIIMLVSHLSTPEGKPHEEGGRVMIRHMKGSRAIGFWSHFIFGLERNQQADDATERKRTYLRCLKDRNTGNATGKVFALDYDDITGLLAEAANDNDSAGDFSGEF